MPDSCFLRLPYNRDSAPSSSFCQSVTFVLIWTQKLMTPEKRTMDLSPKWQATVVMPEELVTDAIVAAEKVIASDWSPRVAVV